MALWHDSCVKEGVNYSLIELTEATFKVPEDGVEGEGAFLWPFKERLNEFKQRSPRY